jgi:hypothetical protein
VGPAPAIGVLGGDQKAQNRRRVGVAYVDGTHQLAERAGVEGLKFIRDRHARGAYVSSRSRLPPGARGSVNVAPIELARRIGGLAGPIATLVVACLAAAGASAAAANSLSASGPRHVQAGQTVKLHFTGYATTDVHRLWVWLDNKRCAATAKAEGSRTYLRTPTKFDVSGPFKAVLKVDHSAAGTHVACGYLVFQGTQATAARASWRYLTQ